ncbi:hypothetical protein [Serratia proteamaculans]|uniref:Uncharacterized protein n=1 Tax=Serratia proteamaculans TaxID=28151 RepID=A0A5Q2V8P5_SERPR|nr:hypothetical protein [Serratia proteamaculans]QGH60768.1 hypothetical protein GHV41_07885 [Serratia proteamaculans]
MGELVLLYIAPGFLLSKFGVLKMNYLKKIDGAINGINCIFHNVALKNHEHEHLVDVKATLAGIQSEMNALYGKRTIAESSRDALLLAIAGTDEGRILDVTHPEHAIQQAIVIIRTMDADIRTNREAEEIPFGAVEQDHEKMQLENRIVELELLFELRMAEKDDVINQLREYQSRWLSVINLIQRLAPDSLNGQLNQMTDTQARHER